MKERMVVIILIVLMALIGCSQSNRSEENQPEGPKNQSTKNLDIQRINLTFSPVSIGKIKEGQPKEVWIKGKSIYFGKLPKQIEATIHLYLESSDDTIETGGGTVYAFLEHEGKLYEIGNVGNYGIEDVSVDLVDISFDGIKDLIVRGGLGSTYIEMKVIGYNQRNQEWMNLLTMGSPQMIDLDGDGNEELIAVSHGSFPSFVEIYRWNNDHFEVAKVTEATGNTYAHLYNEEGKWLIESGKYENGQVGDIHFYRYELGQLIEQDKRD